ncbi:hypothetical protein CVD28_04255 [Bacillus sp. M6-12]|uniref:hypothetical protein n=1 Tax=Bacillus sp. M6-12 TaxID=2054166 RepID=UPI000C768DA8|nr:hypothetical protein [Bacillus sp. M6-12]PLS19637.1 hypothetical protein CVD28_04255 [Bacillus sp. M6-12]
MIKRLAVYGIGIYILGILFSGITLVIMDFVPYFVAGMVLTTPIYGVVRQRTGKGQKINFGMKKVGQGLGKYMKPSKASISVYLVIAVVVSEIHGDLADMLIESAIIGVETLAVAFVLWEMTRFIAKKAKKVQFLSFGEAVKGAF